MQRRTLLVVLAGLAVIAAGVVVLMTPKGRVNRENAARIRPGMTFAQVKAILGPPGNYTSTQWTAPDPDESAWRNNPSFGESPPPDDKSRQWKG
jgi:hypothetical protein